MSEPTVQPKQPTRRTVLRILAVGGAVGAAWKLGWFDRLGGRAVARSRMLMGTIVNLTVLGERDEAGAAADATLERMAALEALLTRYRDDSELSRLNATGHIDAASDALLEVLGVATRVSQLGEGAFDVSVQPVLELYSRDSAAVAGEEIEAAVGLVDYRGIRIADRAVTLAQTGMKLTLDGVGKGYIVDRGLDVLKQRGFDNVFVEAGGDLVAAGNREGGRPWRVGIRHPRSTLSLQARFDASDVAVATSGDYMQAYTDDYMRHHVIDPRTGYSSPELASSTVIAPNAALADALATLTLAMGSRTGRDMLEALPGCEGYFVSKQLEVTKTSGFATS